MIKHRKRNKPITNTKPTSYDMDVCIQRVKLPVRFTNASIYPQSQDSDLSLTLKHKRRQAKKHRCLSWLMPRAEQRPTHRLKSTVRTAPPQCNNLFTAVRSKSEPDLEQEVQQAKEHRCPNWLMPRAKQRLAHRLKSTVRTVAMQSPTHSCNPQI